LKQAMFREIKLGLPAVEEGELHYFASVLRCLLLSLADIVLAPLVLASSVLAFWRAGPMRVALAEVCFRFYTFRLVYLCFRGASLN
jgi:hypothetical protein